MMKMDIDNDKYAGDSAWEEWFEVCAVDRCMAKYPLRRQVESAMYGRLFRYGFTGADAQGDDPVAVFDAYFKLKGSRDRQKPLKKYFEYRIREEGLRMVDFVCGTLFGARSGRIHDIVIDWIATLKGWKPRSVRAEDGRRHLVWESAGGLDAAELEPAVEADPAAFLDVEPFREMVESVLEKISSKTKTEKCKVALLCYVTAQDIPITETAVLEGLGTAKSRAYALREKTMKALRDELKRIDGAESAIFARVLTEVCEANLSGEMRARLGGAT
jgi:hypothetical protein